MLISFKDLVKKYNLIITGVIHVGAHHGEELEDYIDEGIQNIILFEPLIESFEIVANKAMKLNANIEGYNVALGTQTEGSTTMYVSDNEKQSSSILKPKVHLTHHPHVKFPETEEVELATLDQYNTHNYNFI